MNTKNHNPDLDNQDDHESDTAFDDAFLAATGEAVKDNLESSDDTLTDDGKALGDNDDPEVTDHVDNAKPGDDPEPSETMEQMRARLEASEHALKSQIGREKASQRKALELQQENERLNSLISTKDSGEKDDGDSEEDGEDILAELGLKDVIDKKIKPLQDKLDKQEADDLAAADSLDAELQADQLVEKSQQDIQAFQSIKADHSDFEDVLKDPEYGKWFWAQPESVRNQAQSTDPVQVSGVISQYKNSKNSKSEKRSKNLNSLTAVGGRKASPEKRSEEGLDFDAAFNRAINKG